MNDKVRGIVCDPRAMDRVHLQWRQRKNLTDGAGSDWTAGEGQLLKRYRKALKRASKWAPESVKVSTEAGAVNKQLRELRNGHPKNPNPLRLLARVWGVTLKEIALVECDPDAVRTALDQWGEQVFVDDPVRKLSDRFDADFDPEPPGWSSASVRCERGWGVAGALAGRSLPRGQIAWLAEQLEVSPLSLTPLRPREADKDETAGARAARHKANERHARRARRLGIDDLMIVEERLRRVVGRELRNILAVEPRLTEVLARAAERHPVTPNADALADSILGSDWADLEKRLKAATRLVQQSGDPGLGCAMYRLARCLLPWVLPARDQVVSAILRARADDQTAFSEPGIGNANDAEAAMAISSGVLPEATTGDKARGEDMLLRSSYNVSPPGALGGLGGGARQTVWDAMAEVLSRQVHGDPLDNPELLRLLWPEAIVEANPAVAGMGDADARYREHHRVMADRVSYSHERPYYLLGVAWEGALEELREVILSSLHGIEMLQITPTVNDRSRRPLNALIAIINATRRDDCDDPED
ncbi:MAG: hypothetical protein ACPGU7_12425 [Gammaproteobacteria bacterium]